MIKKEQVIVEERQRYEERCDDFGIRKSEKKKMMEEFARKCRWRRENLHFLTNDEEGKS
jgi:uncharacterized protein YeeX (DUF496 family)